MTQKQYALISPRDGFVGLLSDDDRFVTLIAPAAQEGRIVAAGNYANRFPDTAIVEVAAPEEAIEYLAEHQENSLALDFTLLLFDRDVSQQTRNNVSHELNEMLANKGSREYVLDIMLASPLPDEADLEGAIDIAKSRNQVRSLVDTVLECQSRVRQAYSAWLGMRTDPMVQQTGINNVYGALIRFGVFRRLVEEGKTQADVDRLKASIILEQNLTKLCNARIVTRFIAEYSSALSPGLQVVAAEFASIESNLVPDPEDIPDRDSSSRLCHVNSALELQRAESQVEKIADLYAKGSDQPADKFVEELVDSQASNVRDHSHLVKSLCNIATKCRVRGRREISLRCLTRALEFPKGIDAILYIQIGNELRRLMEYDHAIECYEKAREIAHGELFDSINLEIIRVSVARGHYDAALTSYLQIPEIHTQPHMLCALGTLYRKLGNLRKARESYETVVDHKPSFYEARAGLAETAKQSGEHHKAIKRYDAIMSDFPDLDESASKIYSLATSFLFRLTNQPNNAANILETLHEKYPMDCDVHLQLAKLHMLKGETDLAKHHFQRAQGPSLDKVAALLFQTAMGVPTIESLNTEQSYVSDVVLPEDLGLATCNQALSALEQDDYVLARSVVEKPRYVDRLHADFGAVLGYHAKKKIDSTFNYKSDQIICRIAKRGYKELRQSVNAIATGNFEAAQKFERRMCLLIA